jgi:hypothetical protein
MSSHPLPVTNFPAALPEPLYRRLPLRTIETLLLWLRIHFPTPCEADGMFSSMLCGLSNLAYVKKGVYFYEGCGIGCDELSQDRNRDATAGCETSQLVVLNTRI